MVTADVRAAGRSNLDECEFSFVARIAFQESFHRQKSFQNAFRVVDSVYSDAEIECIDSQFLEQGFSLRAG